MKSCLLHGCLPSNCGCPNEISQADHYIRTRMVGPGRFMLEEITEEFTLQEEFTRTASRGVEVKMTRREG